MREDWSTLRKLMFQRMAAGGSLSEYEVTGNPVAFNTNVAKPLSAFTIPFLPVQDLHGYGSPWPTGGGKNLIPFPYASGAGKFSGVSFTVNDDGTLVLNGTATATIYFNLVANNAGIPMEAGDYILHKLAQTVPTGVNITAVKNGSYWGNATTANVSLSLTESANISWYIRVDSGTTLSNLSVFPMFEKGATANDWSPYSNICPITGWQGLTAWRTGANVWDEQWELGTFNSQGQPSVSNTSIRCKNFIPVVPGETYKYINGTGSSQAPWLYDINKEFVSRYGSYMANGATITIPDGVYYIKFALPGTYGDAYKNDVTWNYPSTDTDYHPYTGQSYPVTFPALGKNQWDEQWEVGAYNTSTGAKTGTSAGRIRSAGFIPVTPGSNYKVVGDIDGVCYYDKSKNYLSYSINNSVITIPDDCYFITFYSKTNYGSTYNHDISINYPATETSYEPYTNTVYGGTLDAVNGVLTVEWAKEVFTDSNHFALSTGTNQGNNYYQFARTRPNMLNCMNVLSNMFSLMPIGNRGAETGIIEYSDNIIRVAFTEPDNIKTLNDFDSFVSNNPLEVVYKLATPIEIQLDPITVQTLIGDNTIWTDTNGENTIKYKKKG